MSSIIKGAENCLVGYDRLGKKHTITVLTPILLTCSSCDGEGKEEDGEDCADCHGKGVAFDEHNSTVLDRYLEVKLGATIEEIRAVLQRYKSDKDFVASPYMTIGGDKK